MRTNLKVAVFHHVPLFCEALAKALPPNQEVHCVAFDHRHGRFFATLWREAPAVLIFDGELPSEVIAELARYVRLRGGDVRIVALLSAAAKPPTIPVDLCVSDDCSLNRLQDIVSDFCPP